MLKVKDLVSAYDSGIKSSMNCIFSESITQPHPSFNNIIITPDLKITMTETLSQAQKFTILR